ncbi:MAG: DNA methyltransferase [Opitutaceae bacterium]
MSKYDDLVKKLREIFQIDKPDLDFGIYRIINQRAEQIDNYLKNTLREKVETEIGKRQNADADCKRADLIAQIRDEFGKRAFDDAGDLTDADALASELGQQLTALDAGAATNAEHENAVFSHLLTFFPRYYHKADFISQRRYKGDTYAIPYSGEEVMLHWANKDQYYIKSGENFSNYTFKLDDGRKVHFRLVSADTAKDNRKDNDKDRRFALVENKTVVRTDDEGEEYEETIVPVEECEVIEGGETTTELVLRFEYIPVDKKTKQEALITTALKRIFDDATVKARWLDLSARKPTEKNPQRTVLEKNLTDYTSKNSSDYFIHKDLSGFLSNELDFYIKNEVMHLDDVQDAEKFADIEKSLRMIQCFRAIGQELIRFLAQIEDFQKKLWLKKKFVVETNYCITLDRVPEELYPEIVTNDAQREEWVKLFAIDQIKGEKLGEVAYSEPLSVGFLKANDKLLIDTRFYDNKFRSAALSTLDHTTSDGTLVYSENFQGLRLLKETIRNQCKCVYIDPPYNTNSTPILYKNGYKSSSWNSLMFDRLQQGVSTLSDNGVMAIAIDDAELTNLSTMLNDYSDYYKQSRVAITTNPKGSITKDFNRVHDYTLFLVPHSKKRIARILQENDSPRKMRRWGENSKRTDRKESFYPVYVKNGKVVKIGIKPEDDFHPASKNTIDGELTAIWPIDKNGIERRWNFGLDSIESNLNRITCIEVDGELDLFLTHEETVPKTIWNGGDFDAGKHGNSLLIDLLGPPKKFDFPKSLKTVESCINISCNGESDGIILDYFPGSGTTGHAVVNLNRNDGGHRKYILIEMGAHFKTVLLPRMQKVIYSSDWSDGEPTRRDTGISHCFKYIRLESYEDTLNNLHLKRNDAEELFTDELKDDYLLNYMLDVESQGSLLSVDDFKKPFDYMLKIAADSAGAFTTQKVDLVETFNYLIGLRVKHIDAQFERGYVAVEGTLPSEERCLVLWRDCELVDYDALNKLCEKLQINPKDSEYDVVYINGDHNIPSVTQETEDEGGISRSLKLRQIEPEFLKQMFEVEDV